MKVSLTEQGINDAIRRLNKYKTDVEKANKKALEELGDYGVEYAKQQVATLGAFDTGELYDSISGKLEKPYRYVISTNCGHAKFVEYGTGIRGSESNVPRELPTNWRYNTNPNGWVYKDKDGEYHRTKGMPSRPFMYNTKLEILSLYKETIKKEIKKVGF